MKIPTCSLKFLTRKLMVSFMLGPPLGQGVAWSSEAVWTWRRTAISASAEHLTLSRPCSVSLAHLILIFYPISFPFICKILSQPIFINYCSNYKNQTIPPLLFLITKNPKITLFFLTPTAFRLQHGRCC